jgi:ATP-dependent DNA helicase RecQ
MNDASDSAAELLRERFGFDAFRPGQAEVIGHLLAGRSAAAVFATGSGKSLCYQLPALLFPGLTLVVSPLIALMKDQIDKLQARGIEAQRLDSTLSADESRAIMRSVREGRLRLLYVAPERFNNERFRDAIEGVRVSLFAVDEAHCLSEWGHNFRPDYLRLAGFAKRCRAERVLALTATATPQVLVDICRGFDIDAECAVRTGFYRPNLTLLTTPIAADARGAALIDRLRSRRRGPTVVYVTLQRTAEQMAARLVAEQFPARAYHAGMEDADRSTVQDWFATSDQAVIVATIAFGMGIDKANIRYVYHYNVPKSLENLSQEIGRAGRDGEPSTCEVLVCPDDLNTLENFIYGDTPSPASVQSLVEEVLTRGAEFDLGLVDLSNRHDIRPLVLRTLLTYLELDGYLQEGTPYYSRYQFQPKVSSAEIFQHLPSERAFLTRVFKIAEKARTWFHIDLEAATEALAEPRERIVRVLDLLGERGFLELKVEGVRHRFRRLREASDIGRLAQSLHDRMLTRETRELARLAQVLDLASHDGCQTSRLGEHFGEPLASPCGRCSWCLQGQRAVQMLPRPRVAIDERVLERAVALRAQSSDALADDRALARLLCGLTSPRLSRARLASNALFGALAHVPFAEVLARVESARAG